MTKGCGEPGAMLSLEHKFAQLDEKWKEINNLLLYEHGRYYKHKVAWVKSIITIEMIVWLIENCIDKFSLDLMEYEKPKYLWDDKAYFSFVNKDDAIHFRMVWP